MAGAMLYILFSPSIAQYEVTHDIVRGTAASVDTARMFGEFYPNPGDAIATETAGFRWALQMCLVRKMASVTPMPHTSPI